MAEDLLPTLDLERAHHVVEPLVFYYLLLLQALRISLFVPLVLCLFVECVAYIL